MSELPGDGQTLQSGFLVRGKWIEAGQPVAIRSPYDGKVVGTTFIADRSHLEEAIQAAVSAANRVRQLAAFERKRVLEAIAASIQSRADQFVRLMALEAGKPMKAARVEVERAILTFTTAAEEAVRIYGEYLPLDFLPSSAGRFGIVRRFPVGPTAAITPFNFPLNLVAHKVAPAIACGCPMIVKPAPQTPFCALLLGEIILDAGWPADAISVLALSNEDAGLLVADDRIKLLSFTGSAAVGWHLKKNAGKKRVVLELGGNASVIVHEDADVEEAAERCAAGAFTYAGQSCISVQRIFVHEDIFDDFMAHFVQHAKNLRAGDPLREDTDVGPMIRASDVERVQQWIQEAVQGGAKLVLGGKATGSVLEPTILSATTAQMKVNCEEVFAPVATVEPYSNFDEALDRVNDSRYGLQAAVFTRDSNLIFRAFDKLDVGGVVIGDVPTFRVDPMPYGGVKDSGLGREGVRYAMEEMTERRLLVMTI
jgi:acyl-CoA reductase-like NAD-dependent aldehyde dehydrogenase